jgi:glutathione S-transferase
MKLYMHPVSMTSRPVRLFIAEKGLNVEEEVVDLFTGAHHQEPFISINPNRMVPVLEDGDLRLTESSAILKYLAEKFDLPEYPKDLKERARVNEVMDWFNTNFYRDWAYNLAYPQIFPHHKRAGEEAQKVTLEWGKENARKWLQILNDHWLGPDKAYLTGERITIADYFGGTLLTLGEIIRCDLSQYPNVGRWMSNMKALRSWEPVNEAFYALVDSTKDQSFEHI